MKTLTSNFHFPNSLYIKYIQFKKQNEFTKILLDFLNYIIILLSSYHRRK